jgi:pentatricopeptide repeat protein
MGLFSFFARNWDDYARRGDELLLKGRTADAREAFLSALEKLPSGREDIRGQLETKVSEAANALALLNIREAEGCLAAGEVEKAAEYAAFAVTLAEDVHLRQMAEKITVIATTPSSGSSLEPPPSKCSGSCCEPPKAASQADSVEPVPLEEEYELLIHTLPGDLPSRYRSLGEEFADAFMASRGGDIRRAIDLFDLLLKEEENDILLYESALLLHQAGRVADAETSLKRGMGLCPGNPLIRLALVDLFEAEGRWTEAREVLHEMVALGVMPETARLLLAEVVAASGNPEEALNLLGALLDVPQARQEAAKRIVSLLHQLGRDDEAKNVTKHYLKGCC